MNGRVGVVRGRVAVGKNSCTTPSSSWSSLIEFGRAWSGNLGDRDDRVDPIGGENLP